jgi:hypothetical protein
LGSLLLLKRGWDFYFNMRRLKIVAAKIGESGRLRLVPA